MVLKDLAVGLDLGRKNVQMTFLSTVPIEMKLLAVILLQWFFMLAINQTVSASFLLATTSDSC